MTFINKIKSRRIISQPQQASHNFQSKKRFWYFFEKRIHEHVSYTKRLCVWDCYVTCDLLYPHHLIWMLEIKLVKSNSLSSLNRCVGDGNLMPPQDSTAAWFFHYSLIPFTTSCEVMSLCDSFFVHYAEKSPIKED